MKKKRHHGALEYILWGEKQVTRKRQKTKAGIPWPKTETVKNRKPGWYSIPPHNLEITCNFLLYVHSDRFFAPMSKLPIASDRCFHRIYLRDSKQTYTICAALNSIITALFISLYGRWNLGQGALKFETTDANKLPVISPAQLNEKSVKPALERLSARKVGSIFNEIAQPDRRELDDIVFDILGLTEDERNEVYWAVCELVHQRLEKARSR